MENIDEKMCVSISTLQDPFGTPFGFLNVLYALENLHTEGDCFVDDLSITCKIKPDFLKAFQDYMTDTAYMLDDKTCPRLPSMDKFMLRVFDMPNIWENGTYYDFQYTHSTVFCDFDLTREAFQLRLEFNPTKLQAVQHRFLARVIDWSYDLSVSRMDITFDFDKDLSKLFIFDKSQRRHKSDYSINGGSILTGRYFGTRKSSLYLRLYDKKRDSERFLGGQQDDYITDVIKKHGTDWWRLEWELKDKTQALSSIDAVRKSILDTFAIYFPVDVYPDDLSVVDKIVLKEIFKDYSVLKDMGRKQALRYKRLLKEHSLKKVDLMPDIERRFDNVVDTLTYLYDFLASHD